MAEYYTQSSTTIPIPKEKVEQAQAIIDRVTEELESEDDEYVGFVAEIQPGCVWITHDETLEPTHAERLVRDLVEELDLPDLYIVEWGHSCSRPIVGSFGGGAFGVRKGRDTIWADPVGYILGIDRQRMQEAETKKEV